MEHNLGNIEQMLQDAEILYDSRTHENRVKAGMLYKEIIENTDDPKHLSTAWLYLGMIVDQRGDLEGAEFYYRTAMHYNEFNTFAIEALADAYDVMGKQDEADELLNAVDEINSHKENLREKQK